MPAPRPRKYPGYLFLTRMLWSVYPCLATPQASLITDDLLCLWRSLLLLCVVVILMCFRPFVALRKQPSFWAAWRTWMMSKTCRIAWRSSFRSLATVVVKSAILGTSPRGSLCRPFSAVTVWQCQTRRQDELSQDGSQLQSLYLYTYSDQF